MGSIPGGGNKTPNAAGHGQKRRKMSGFISDKATVTADMTAVCLHGNREKG